MLTWLPYPDFIESVGALEIPELVSSCRDAIFILDVRHQVKPHYAVWEAHPAVRMWRGHEVSLAEYGLSAAEEIEARKLRTPGARAKALTQLEQHMDWATSGRYTMEKPSWFGEALFHIAHQSNLIRHSLVVYGEKFHGVPADLPYYWPVP